MPSLRILPPPPKLSELEIDVDKDWLSRTIMNFIARALKVTVIPPTAGADAFIVRDKDDTFDRVKITEDGRVITGTTEVAKFDDVGGYMELSRPKMTGDLIPDEHWTRNIGLPGLVFYAMRCRYLYANELAGHGVWRTWDPFRPFTDLRTDIGRPDYRWRDIWYGRNLYAKSAPATDVDTMKDSPPAIFRGAYWNGTKSVDVESLIYFDVYSTAPWVRFLFKVLGEVYMSLENKFAGWLKGVIMHEQIVMHTAKRIFARRGDGTLGYEIGDGAFVNNARRATATEILRDSPFLQLTGTYWTGDASADRRGRIFQRMLSEVPESEWVVQIADVDYMRIGDRGVKLDKIALEAGWSQSIDAGATYLVPIGSYYVSLGAYTVAEYYDDVAGAWVEFIPVGGKDYVISDGTNVRLRNTGTVAEISHLRRVL